MTADTPEACDRLFAECIARGDLDALLALYEPEAGFVRRDGSVVHGHAALRQELAPLAADRLQFRMDVRRVARAGDDLAVLYNAWSVEVPGDGGRKETLRGHALEVVRRQADGSWRFVLDDPEGWRGE